MTTETDVVKVTESQANELTKLGVEVELAYFVPRSLATAIQQILADTPVVEPKTPRRGKQRKSKRKRYVTRIKLNAVSNIKRLTEGSKVHTAATHIVHFMKPNTVYDRKDVTAYVAEQMGVADRDSVSWLVAYAVDVGIVYDASKDKE
ncbi:MAG TPA: hypothetical protein VKP88_07905 [Candidatus Paceibacterota bacterium]|nr:hypothetical protein [Candidatus Paceibacterota bacterium]